MEKAEEDIKLVQAERTEKLKKYDEKRLKYNEIKNEYSILKNHLRKLTMAIVNNDYNYGREDRKTWMEPDTQLLSTYTKRLREY